MDANLPNGVLTPTPPFSPSPPLPPLSRPSASERSRDSIESAAAAGLPLRCLCVTGVFQGEVQQAVPERQGVRGHRGQGSCGRAVRRRAARGRGGTRRRPGTRPVDGEVGGAVRRRARLERRPLPRRTPRSAVRVGRAALTDIRACLDLEESILPPGSRELGAAYRDLTYAAFPHTPPCATTWSAGRDVSGEETEDEESVVYNLRS